MRPVFRLTYLALCLAAMAIGLVALRARTASVGNQVHAMYRRKRQLEKSCWHLHLAIADLKNVDRLRSRAAEFEGLVPPDPTISVRPGPVRPGPGPGPGPAGPRRPVQLAERPGARSAAGFAGTR
jgi:hypothetical protein